MLEVTQGNDQASTTPNNVAEPKNDQAVQQDQKEPTIKELMASMEAMKEDFKNQLAGVNKSYSAEHNKVVDLEKKLKEKEKEKMTAEERAAAELQEIRSEKERIAAENALMLRQRIIDKALDSAELPLEIFNLRIIGEDENEIKKDVGVLKKYIDDLVKKKAETVVNAALSGAPPKTGQTAPGATMSRSDFQKMSPTEQQAFAIKPGAKITD